MISLIVLLWACGWVVALGIYKTRCRIEMIDVIGLGACAPLFIPVATFILWRKRNG